MMAEKPILFNAEMVKAILDGRKTQTRRLIKPQPQSRLAYCYAGTDRGTWGYPTATAHEFWGADFELPRGLSESEKQYRWKPPCEADDILWVRETWQYIPESDTDGFYVYAADREDPADWKWRPSIHMPREAARLFLPVKAVRVERLQDMTTADAEKEGAETDDWLDLCEEAGVVGLPTWSLREYFGHHIWDRTINGEENQKRYGWDANPWVWVIEFECIDKPKGWCES